MQHKDYERILYNILSGEKFVEVKNKTIKVISPDVTVVNEANYLYQKTLENSTGSYDKASLQRMLIKRGLFFQRDLDFIRDFPAKLKRLQKNLYYNRDNQPRKEAIKKDLKLLRDEYEKTSILVSSFDSFTKEGVASQAKTTFILTKTCFHRDKLVKYNKYLYDLILGELYGQHISQEDIRYIARNPPWVNMWIGLKNNGVIFKNGVSLSVEQQGLLMWTRIYDSLAECHEPPERYVVEDDDMFDGWMADRENKKPQKEEKHEEIFVVANSPDDIDRINNMNSGASKHIKNQRLDFIYQNKEVKESQLPDKAQEIALQFSQMEAAYRRGK